jgi:hypothetical protein
MLKDHGVDLLKCVERLLLAGRAPSAWGAARRGLWRSGRTRVARRFSGAADHLMGHPGGLQ